MDQSSKDLLTPDNDSLRRRDVTKDDGRRLYSYTFGGEPDPFENADGAATAQPLLPVKEDNA